MSKEHLFICFEKWANYGLKNQSLLLPPANIYLNEGLFFVENLRVVFQSSFSSSREALTFVLANLFTVTSNSLRRGELKAAIILGLSFAVTKHSFAMVNIFIMANQLMQIFNFILIRFLPSLCLIFLLNLQNISKWGI